MAPPKSPIVVTTQNGTNFLTMNEAATTIMATLRKTFDEANAMLEMIKHNEYAIHIPASQTHYRAFLTWPKEAN